jgi:hypothetical protein
MQKKIELMIAGAQKAGTTSLNKYLSQHPKICTHSTIEFGMFANVPAYEKGFDYYYKNTVTDNVKDNPEKSIFVAKRVGLMCNQQLLNKLKEHNPNVKVAMVLRNPIERAFSAFLYCRNSGMEPYTEFNDAIYKNDPKRFKGNEEIKKNCQYVYRSSYLQHLQNVYAVFPAENIRVYLFEEMISNLNVTLNDMISQIGLGNFDFDVSMKYNERQVAKSSLLTKLISPGKSSFIKNIIPLQQRTKLKQALRGANANKKAKETDKKVIEPDTRSYLQEVFKKDIKELQEFTHLPLKQYWPEFF